MYWFCQWISVMWIDLRRNRRERLFTINALGLAYIADPLPWM